MKDWAADLLNRCKESGFPLAGILDLARADDVSPGFSDHFARYENWIRAGYHGEMKYLERGLERRRDPRNLFPEAKSILALAIPYHRSAPETDSAESPRYARYIQGPDYHKRIPETLTRVLEDWKVRWEETYPDPKWKICVDTSALLERSWASLAGLGWIGKNTLLIHPKHGSYLFLSFILLNLESDQGPSPLPNYCGNCSRCLEGCPTGAIEVPGRVNSKRCISYLTLEKRGEILDEALKKSMGKWIAGCDICQEVCPFNQKPSRFPETWDRLPEHEATSVTKWKELLSESEGDYRSRTRNSSLERIKWRDWQRNLAISLHNVSRESPAMLDELSELIEAKLTSSLEQADLHTLWTIVSENSKA